MSSTVCKSLCLTALLFFASAAQAGGREQLQAFTHGLKGLDGQFVQQVYDGSGRLKESSSGRVALSAPRLFRWEYVTPYEQLIIADGVKVWIYEPDLQQVSVRDQNAEEQGNPLAALLEPARLDEQFTVVETGERGDDGLQWLQLTPKGDGQLGFQTASLGFGGGGLERMEIVDGVGQHTLIAFTGWKRNPVFAAGTFRYVPAEGVDVVGGL
jgi:outer membrane lipoprotein carrier protein